MTRILEVVVSPSGQTTVQTQGYSGSECLGASQWLEKALGIAVADQKTSDYFQTGKPGTAARPGTWPRE